MNNIDLKTITKAAKKFTKGGPMPILETVLIKNGNLYFTDLETSLVVKEFIENKNINGCVSTSRFFETLNLLQDEKFKIEQRSGFLEFKTKSDKIKVPLLKEDEFPETPAGTDYLVCGYPTHKDMEAIYKAFNFVSKEEMRPAMQNVYLNHYVCGTDGHRMYFDKTEAIILGTEIQFIPKAIELLKIFDPDSPKISKHYLKTNINRARFDNIEIYWLQPTQTYPDFLSVIPLHVNGTVEINKNDVLKTLKKLTIALDPHHKKVEIEPNCSKTYFRAENLDENISIASEINSINTGELQTFGVNHSLFESVIKLVEADTITLDFETPTKALLFNKNYLLMPVRLN